MRRRILGGQLAVFAATVGLLACASVANATICSAEVSSMRGSIYNAYIPFMGTETVTPANGQNTNAWVVSPRPERPRPARAALPRR